MGTKRPKLAFIHPDLGIGGAERLILDMANALKDDNDVIFLTNHFDPTHSFDELKSGLYEIHVYGDWIPRSVFGKCQALCAYFRMVYLILTYLLFYRKGDVDLYVVDLIPIAIPFLKLAKEKVIYYCHHPDLLATTRESALKRLYRKPIDWVEYEATKTSNTTLVNSRYTAEVFKETFPKITKTIQVLYPTISTSIVDLLSKSEEIPEISSIVEEIPKGSFVFLSINRFHPAKKLELAVEAMGCLEKILPESKWKSLYLIIAGGFDPRSEINSDYYKSLRDLTKRLDLEKKVVYLKSPTDSVKVQLLQACNCLIYTPVKEHFGIVPLEAMMAKKPVIACNSGGPRETVEDGNNGFLCEPNPESLAECMGKIMNGNSLEMGEKGRRRLAETFSNEIFAERLKNIVQRTLDE